MGNDIPHRLLGDIDVFIDKEFKRIRPIKPEKKCLNCGSPHRHNNSYCSAKCCREYRLTNQGE